MNLNSLESQSEKLTPIEIKNKEFKKSVWGYSPQEVVDFLDQMARTWELVQKHEKDLIGEIQHLNSELNSWKNREAELDHLREKAREDARQIKEKATDDAEKMLAEVKDRADEIRQQTEEWLATVINEVEETEKKRDSFVNAFRAALDQHYALLDNGTEGIRPLEAQLGKFLREDSKAAAMRGRAKAKPVENRPLQS